MSNTENMMWVQVRMCCGCARARKARTAKENPNGHAEKSKCPYGNPMNCDKYVQRLFLNMLKFKDEEWLARMPEEFFVAGIKAHGYSGDLVKTETVTF